VNREAEGRGGSPDRSPDDAPTGGPDDPSGDARYDPSGDALYAALKRYEGRAAATAGTGKDPVNGPMIRHWCEAMGDAHPAYRGPAAVAPPTMLQAWTMGGLSGHTDRSAAYGELFGLLDGAGFRSVVATDCEQEYLRPLRPGDRITFDAVIESVSARKTTKLGTGYFVTTRTDVRAEGELAGTHRFRILKYAPAARTSQPDAGPRPAPEAALKSEPALRSEPALKSEPDPGTVPRRPRPVINRDNAGFWAGVAEHRLLIQRCGGCGRLRFPWLPGCQACGSPEWDTVEAGGAGSVYSYVVMHHPPFPAFATPGPVEDTPAPHSARPYAVALVELAEGVRILGNVVGVAYDEVRIGMPVRLEFRRVDPELELPFFRAGGAG
jgi:uncharacterized OB-fold protein